MKRKLKENNPTKGQSLVEFAVSLVLLMIIFAGIIDLGSLFFYYIAMRDASQEGVVYGIVNPNHCNQIADRARSILSSDTYKDENGVLQPIQITTLVNGTPCSSATTADACSGKSIEVTITNPKFPITTPLLGTFLGTQSLVVDASVSGTILRPPCPSP